MRVEWNPMEREKLSDRVSSLRAWLSLDLESAYMLAKRGWVDVDEETIADGLSAEINGRVNSTPNDPRDTEITTLRAQLAEAREAARVLAVPLLIAEAANLVNVKKNSRVVAALATVEKWEGK